MIKHLILIVIFIPFLNSEIKAHDFFPVYENIEKMDCEVKTLQDLKKFSEDNLFSYKKAFSDSIETLDTIITDTLTASDTTESNSVIDSTSIDTNHIDSTTVIRTDSVETKINLTFNDDKPVIEKKNFPLLAAELFILELIPLGIAKFITKPGWEKISMKSWWENISRGFTYDTDNFLTNHFSHPYHGNLYFNAARTNGYGFWQSAPFAFLGSAVWEYFAETYRPSINDWINTSVSGVNLGEMTYRIANMITDNEATGFKRVYTEILGGIINPVRAVNRLLHGETSRVFPNTPLKRPEYFSFSINVGLRRIVNEGSNIAKNGFQEGIFGFDVNYGDQFKSDIKIPFSTFFVSASLSNGSSLVSDLRSYGILTGWKLRESESNQHSLSMLLSYDFTSNPAYEFGGPSLSANLGSKYEFSKKFTVISNVNFGFLMMGGAPDDYFEGEEGRNYNFGTGMIARAYVSFNGANWQYGSLSYSTFWFWTQSGTPDSRHHVHNFNAMGLVPFNAYFAIGGSFGLYYRASRYIQHDDVRRTSPILRLFLITKL